MVQSICSGSTYDFFGTSLSSDGTFTHALQSINGCDSIIQLNLDVYSVYYQTVDTTITQGTSYILPSGNVVIASGIYRDTLSSINHCDSIIVTNLDVVSGISEFETLNSEFRIIPNPARNELFIHAKGAEISSVLLYSVDGKLIKEVTHFSAKGIDVSSFSSGVYIAEVNQMGVVQRVKWVKM